MTTPDSQNELSIDEKHGACLTSMFGLVTLLTGVFRLLFMATKPESTLKQERRKQETSNRPPADKSQPD